jgi:hypothetical protein
MLRVNPNSEIHGFIPKEEIIITSQTYVSEIFFHLRPSPPSGPHLRDFAFLASQIPVTCRKYNALI